MKKVFNNILDFFKSSWKEVFALIIFMLVVNYELPYYIEAPGGTINITKRIDKNYNKKDGSLNMLYVTHYKGNVATLLLGKIISSWDIYDISNQQVSDENSGDIYLRNKIMLDNSIQNAIFVAYKEAGKEIEIKRENNYVIATTKENDFKIGDRVISIDGVKIINVDTIKEELSKRKVGGTVNIIIERDEKEKQVSIVVPEDGIIGIAVITNYEYELEDEVDLKFKYGEGGSSGGLVLSLAIYSEITGKDILKGRNIAGTGTIDIDGNVGEIDGIKYKIAGASKKKMDVVLVSPNNYDEAMKVVQKNNYDLEIVKVSTFEEAINYLIN